MNNRRFAEINGRTIQHGVIGLIKYKLVKIKISFYICSVFVRFNFYSQYPSDGEGGRPYREKKKLQESPFREKVTIPFFVFHKVWKKKVVSSAWKYRIQETAATSDTINRFPNYNHVSTPQSFLVDFFYYFFHISMYALKIYPGKCSSTCTRQSSSNSSKENSPKKKKKD